jgi:hypothetical protein
VRVVAGASSRAKTVEVDGTTEDAVRASARPRLNVTREGADDAVLLVGGDVALLEGLAQSLAAQGHAPAVATSLAEARELASTEAATGPRRQSVAGQQCGRRPAGHPARGRGARASSIARRRCRSLRCCPRLQRSVLADLTLPLERHRLAALVQSLGERARVTDEPSALAAARTRV